jgi:hypothetical protein
VVYKGEILPGSQIPIIDVRLFNAVQAKLAEQQNNHVKTRAKSEALLVGRLFDDQGNRMSPSHTRKQGIKYRYYISRPLLEGRKDQVGSVSRVPADEIENAVIKAVRRVVAPTPEITNGELLRTYLTRVEVHPTKLIVELKPPKNKRNSDNSKCRKTLHVSWQKPPIKRRREIIVPESMSRDAIRPIRTDARARLITAIARGRNWLNELVTNRVTDVDAIAKREHCSVRRINMTISLAFLAPDLVKAAIEGRLPRGIGIARLCDPPAVWSGQYRKLGLTSPHPAH